MQAVITLIYRKLETWCEKIKTKRQILRWTDRHTYRQSDRRETDTLMSGSQLEMQTCQHEMFYSLRVIYVIYSNVGRVKENHGTCCCCWSWDLAASMCVCGNVNKSNCFFFLIRYSSVFASKGSRNSRATVSFIFGDEHMTF